MTSEPIAKDLTGCFGAAWQLVVVGPMRWILLFVLLSHTDGLPSWAWVLFWSYVPANVLGLAFLAPTKLVTEGK